MRLNSPRIGSFFHQEREGLKTIFARLHYPETLVENTIRHFAKMKVTGDICTKQQVSDEHDNEKLANTIRHQLADLIQKTDAVIQPVCISRKIKGQFKRKEHKPPIVNQQNVVWFV